MQVPSVVYNPWHKNRVALYTACIRVNAAVDPDLTRIHPNAIPVVTKQSHFTNVLIGWSVVKSTAVAAMPIVGPVVRDTTGSKHPRKKRLFDDWSEQRFEKNQVPEVDQMSG
jgi:hypothetical protein